MALIIDNGEVLSADGGLAHSRVTIDGDRIVDVGGAVAAGVRRLDASGLLVLPGIVDLHGDGFERSLMPRPGVYFDHTIALAEMDRGLVAHGITTAYLGLTVSWEPGLRSLDAGRALVASLARLRPSFAADVRLHIRWETFALDCIDAIVGWLELEPRPILAFNDHTTGTIEHRTDPVKLRKWAERSGLEAAAYQRLVGEVAERRPRVEAGVAQLAAVARRRGITMLSHDDRTRAERARYRDLGATVAEFPLTREVIEDSAARGEATVLGAPNVLRGGSHTGALTATEMIEAGLCSVLASDYYYPAQLHAAFKLVGERRLPLGRVWPLVSRNPARAAGLDDRGDIAVGQRADLILVDAGTMAEPRVVATIVGGELVHASRRLD